VAGSGELDSVARELDAAVGELDSPAGGVDAAAGNSIRATELDAAASGELDAEEGLLCISRRR
jgi:hypothetical protein